MQEMEIHQGPLKSINLAVTRLDGRATEFSTDGQHSIGRSGSKVSAFFSLFAFKIGNKIDGEKERERRENSRLFFCLVGNRLNGDHVGVR